MDVITPSWNSSLHEGLYPGNHRIGLEMWLEVIPGLELKHLEGWFPRHKYVTFQTTCSVITAIKLQAWPFFKHPSLYPQFTSQRLTSLGTCVADKRVLYAVFISSGAKSANCLWLPLCLIVAMCLSHVLSHSACVFTSQHSEPSEEQDPALPERTSLTHGKIFVKPFLGGSAATNYLSRVSQPTRRLDRWLWPQQTWGPSLGWHILYGCCWRERLMGWGAGIRGCEAYFPFATCTVQASGRQGQVRYPDGSILYYPCECTPEQSFHKHTYTRWHFFPNDWVHNPLPVVPESSVILSLSHGSHKCSFLW